ncbi:MAG: hypothetical protein QNJ75_01845 [Acidimicrobiia bacterium]|nr:hypothetical protein [Acidimicrobiia bacterium]
MRWRILVVIAIALLGAGCSDDQGTTTTEGVAPGDDVVFGEGSLPETIPDGFPLPAGSAVGSTMVVNKTGFTEAIVRISAELGISAEFFNQSLAQGGFAVVSSEATDDGWLIVFTMDSARGTIDLTEPMQGISQAVVRYNVP